MKTSCKFLVLLTILKTQLLNPEPATAACLRALIDRPLVRAHTATQRPLHLTHDYHGRGGVGGPATNHTVRVAGSSAGQ